MNKKISILLLALSLSLSLNSATLIQGDKDAPTGQTFSFNVDKNILSSMGNFYEGARENLLANQEFTLSKLMRGAAAFMPLAPETVTLNGNNGVSNPLFGAHIIALGILEAEEGFSMRDMPVVVTAQSPATIYLLENIASNANIEMISSLAGDVHDATGAVSSGVVSLTTNSTNHVFAAVKPNGGEFGQPNSGIALLTLGTLPGTADGKPTTFRIFSEVNVDTGKVEDPKALLLDANSPELFINTPIATILQNHALMHWDGALERLYVGLNVITNNGATSGARSIVTIKFIEDGAITLESIAPDSAFVDNNIDSIIGVIGANQQLSINALKTMWTSTALNYLIIVGGNGNPSATNNSVFALPLVNAGDSKGMIAQKDAQPVNIFKNANVPRLIARTISEAATTPADMTQSTDVAAQVGGGSLTAGPIVDIIVRNDTVFAFVGKTDPSVDPGVYSSQAIFDASGKITSWTAWQRAAGTTDSIFGAELNAGSGNFILASGTNADTVNTIKRTVWSNGSPEGLEPLTTILDNALPSNNGGIQGLQTFLPQTPGLNTIALLAAGGIGSIALAETGLLNDNNIIIPTNGPDFNTMMEFDNGTITSNVNAKTVIISGGALDIIGPVTALEIARNAQNGWLFVGGSDGLAILMQADGTGWDPTTQLGDNLTGLQTGMIFTIIGDYKFVKKLIYDGDFLFVISHTTVDRINLTTSNFGTNTLDVTTIASIGKNGVATRGGFLDGIFSQACAIIATTDGLLRIGNDKDVRTIANEADADWIPVAIGENAGAPTALYTVTQTNRAQDITKNSGGHFYVLTANVGLDQSRINRFAVKPLDPTASMGATTVQPFDDLFVKNIPSFLLSFGEFRSNFATDGALYFATRNQNIALDPVVLLTPSAPVPRVGVANVGDRSAIVKVNIQSGTEINYFSRSQASGSWIAAGNFDTQVLE
jgi:hypothetical protein